MSSANATHKDAKQENPSQTGQQKPSSYETPTDPHCRRPKSKRTTMPRNRAALVPATNRERVDLGYLIF